MLALLRTVGKLAVTVVPVSQVARLGLPAFVLLVGLLAFLAAAALAWTYGGAFTADRQ